MVEKIAQILDHQFREESLLTEALTHASSAGHRLLSNERLEFLGDAILGFVVCEHLYRNYPDLLEGDLTKIKSTVVSRRTCARISHSIGLTEMLVLGKGMSSRRALPSSVSAAAIESIIGALYLDGGMEPTRRFIIDKFGPYIDEAARSAHQQNFKSVLQQYCQRHLPQNPCYVLLDEKGPDHAKAFEVAVALDGRRFASAWANSKKEAEQKAALLALSELNLVEVDSEGHVRLLEPVASEATP